MHQSCDIQYNDIFKYYPYIIDGEYSVINDGFYGVDERHRYHWFSSKDWEEAWPNKSCVHCMRDCGMTCLQDNTNTVDLRKVDSRPMDLLFSMVGRVAITGRYNCELAQSIRPAVDLLCKRSFTSRSQVRYYERLDEDDEGNKAALNDYSNKFSEELCELEIESEPVEGESDKPVLTAIFSIYRDNDTQEVAYSLSTGVERFNSRSLVSISELPDSKKVLLEDYLRYIDLEEPIKIQNGNVDLQNVTEEVKSMILDYLEQLREY